MPPRFLDVYAAYMESGQPPRLGLYAYRWHEHIVLGPANVAATTEQLEADERFEKHHDFWIDMEAVQATDSDETTNLRFRSDGKTANLEGLPADVVRSVIASLTRRHHPHRAAADRARGW